MDIDNRKLGHCLDFVQIAIKTLIFRKQNAMSILFKKLEVYFYPFMILEWELFLLNGMKDML